MNAEAKSDVRVVNVEPQDLLVRLTEDEINKRARRLATLGKKIQDMQASLAAANKLAKGEIAKEEAIRQTIQNEVNVGACVRSVPCQEIHDFKTRTVKTIRCDTGDEVGSARAMTVLETQRELDFGEAVPESDDHDSDGFFTRDETPEQRAAIRPPLPGFDDISEEDPDTSILDAKAEEPHDTEAPPPDLKTEKRPRASRKNKAGGK